MHNTVYGTAASGLVQAGSITGGVHYHSTTVPQWPTPQQLPPAPPWFVGRPSELLALTETIPPPGATTVAISTLTGPGGIGKTSVALHWAHQHNDRYPDGQLYVDLRGFSRAGDRATAAAALRDLLSALGVPPDRVPEHLDGRTALYRSLVASRRMLIVLDNAFDAEQVVPLLPGSPTCTVLVTGRTILPSLIDRHGARHLTLNVLAHDEARTLLVTRIGADRASADPAAVDELVRLCGHYPLALVITARTAAARPTVPLAEIAAELRELGLAMLDHDSDPAASLPAVLSWSYDALSPRERTAFSLLGLAPGPDIGLPAAACLVDLPARETRRSLTALVEASLLRDDGRARYRMHDLVRDYAASTAEQNLTRQTQESAVRRLLDFYIHTADHADRLLNPRRRPAGPMPPTPAVLAHTLHDTTDASAWFDREHLNLLAGQRIAVHRQWDLATWQLAWALATYHQRRGHGQDRLAVWEAALDAATRLPDPIARVRAHRHLGHAYAEAHRLHDAFKNLDRALTLAREHGDIGQQAHTHRTLAWMWERAERRQQALTHAERALTLYRELRRPADEAAALNQVGWLSMRGGDDVAAREHCYAALALHRRHHNLDGEAYTLDSLGRIAQNSGFHQQAIDHYKQALTTHRALGNDYSVADTLDRLGIPYLSLGLHQSAREAWNEALTAYLHQQRNDSWRVRGRLAHLERLAGTTDPGAEPGATPPNPPHPVPPRSDSAPPGVTHRESRPTGP
ncbi:ATP-binding protein [Saccharothrix saharensis]|uniref:ATP-binding protein n=1 Tax=Saccharothrix saharensis TaxID=571190 RepID=UPI00367F1749